MTAYRTKACLVSPELLLEIARSGDHAYHVDSKIPDTARFHHCVFEHQSNAFRVFFEDESFPLIAEGMIIETLPAPVLTVLPLPNSEQQQRHAKLVEAAKAVVEDSYTLADYDGERSCYTDIDLIEVLREALEGDDETMGA